MNLATWKSLKSPIMQEIRQALKLKQESGKHTPYKKEANRAWREDILGFFSEDQKKAFKAQKQENTRRKSKKSFYQEDE